MKKTLWILGIVAILGIIVWIVGMVSTPAGQTSTSSTGASLPVAGSVPYAGTPGGSGTTTPNQMVLSSAEGKAIITKDFIHNGETIADVMNPGSYQLAGSLGYCLANGTCPGGATSTDFNISYNGTTQFFNIVLLKEPLSLSRNAAEQFLGTLLGISNDQLCSLKYFVGTPYYVNSFYSGKNLGFSFCPGATVLPK